MKKHICTLISILLILSISGCSNNNDTNNYVNSNSYDVNSENQTKNTNNKEINFTTPYDITECYLGYFIATTNDGRLYGMLDSNGNIVIDFTYDKLTFGADILKRRENIIYATTESGTGTIDFNENILIPFEFDEIKEYSKYCDYTFAKSKGDTYLISEDYTKSKIDIPLVRNDLLFINALSDNYFSAAISSTETAIYNLSCEQIATYILPFCKRVSENYICIQETINNEGTFSSKLSFFDTNFNLCSTIENSDLNYNSMAISDYASNETGIAELTDGKKVLVDFSTGEIITSAYKNIGKFYNEKAFAIDSNSSLSIIDYTGKTITSYNDIQGAFKLTSGVAITSNSDTYRLYNRDGQDIFNERFYSYDLTDEYLLIENLDGNYALINKHGNIAFDFGTITESTIYGYTKSNEFFNDDMYCAVIDNGESNTVYAYIN